MQCVLAAFAVIVKTQTLNELKFLIFIVTQFISISLIYQCSHTCVHYFETIYSKVITVYRLYAKFMLRLFDEAIINY